MSGTNTVDYRFDATDTGNVNLDNNAVTSTPTASPTPTSTSTSTPTTTTTPTPTVPAGGTVYEAEKAFSAGGARPATAATGASGGGYVEGFTTVGARTVFTVNSATTSTQAVEFRYATTTATSRSLSVYVNGDRVHALTLAGTASPSAWATAVDNLALRRGLNTLQLRYDSGDSGNINLDQVRLASGPAMSPRGATLPYEEQEAESAATNGRILGPDRTYLTIASESSGRRAVRLEATGQYVQFTLTRPASALVVRYAVPDSANGAPTASTLGLYVNGSRTKSVPLTNRYSWVYGGYPYNNDPAQGSAHHFFDEARTTMGALPAGTVVKLQKDASDTAAYYVIDLVDFEQVDAAPAMPAGYLSLTSYGATANDGVDDTAALNAAIAAAKSQARGLWIPAGTFDINARVNVDHVTVRGAGPWYAVLQGHNGKGGLFATGDGVGIFDLAIFGDVSYRDDANFDTAIEGNFGTGSTVQNVWMEHVKVGMWVDGPTDGLFVVGVRIRDTFADGVNLHRGTKNTRLDQSVIRNTGDDGLAMFSEGTAVQNSGFTFDTVQLPLLANAVGIYGGADNRVEDSILSDTVTGRPASPSAPASTPFPSAEPPRCSATRCSATGVSSRTGTHGSVRSGSMPTPRTSRRRCS